MIQLGVVIIYLNQPGVEIEKVYYSGGGIRNIKCVGDVLFKLKLIQDVNYQYYQTSGVKTLTMEARYGMESKIH